MEHQEPIPKPTEPAKSGKILFLSRVTMVFNIAFILFVILSKMEHAVPVSANPNVVYKMPILKGLLVVLGFSAIIVNFFMCLTYSILVIMGKTKIVPIWLAAINLIFLMLQIFYFFF